jgi:Cu/Ag efflux protein CusF
MLKRKLFWLPAILAIVMMVGVVGCTPAELQALQGTLQNVDSVSGNVTVKMKDGTTQTFNFTDVKLETIRQTLGNATLEIGDQVTVRAHRNGKVEQVDVENAEVHGIIKELVAGTGTGTGTMTITTIKKGDITLNITPDTKIRIEDKGTAAFADLKAGQEVEAKYEVSSMNTLRINVEINDEEGEIEGTIKSIDTTANTVTITTQKKGDIVLKVTPKTIIRIEDKGTAALSELKAGQKIEAKYDVSTMEALKLNVENGDDEQDGENNNNHQGEAHNELNERVQVRGERSEIDD